MARSTWKTRLQTYHAKDIDTPERKGVLLSNTTRCVQKIVTSVPLPASHTETSDGYDGPAEMTVNEGMDFHAKLNTSVTSCTDFKLPAALCIRTKAK